MSYLSFNKAEHKEESGRNMFDRLTKDEPQGRSKNLFDTKEFTLCPGLGNSEPREQMCLLGSLLSQERKMPKSS